MAYLMDVPGSESEVDFGPNWHPHLGEIGGKGLADILAGYAPVFPRQSIILASGERTGSEWLCELMGQTGRLGRPSEYLNTPWMRRFIADYPEDPAAQIGLARQLGTTANGCLAIKLHPWHFDRLSAGVDLSLFPNPKFVLLNRADLLGQAISLVRARQTEKFHSFTTPTRAPVYDAAQIDDALREVIVSKARWSKFFARNGISPLELSYERFAQNPSEALTQIAAFAGVELPAHLAQGEARLGIQRDGLSQAWRQRFLAEKHSLSFLDPL